MRIPDGVEIALSDQELATAIWLAFENAGRLIDDATTLVRARRFVGAQAVLRTAVEEIAKLLLLNQAIYWEKNDDEKWLWLWKAWDDHREKLRIVEYLVHWDSYQDKDEFRTRITTLLKSREWLWYVDFDPQARAFRSPVMRHNTEAEAENATSLELRYANILFGLTTVASEGGSIDGILRIIPMSARPASVRGRGRFPPMGA